MTNAAHTPGPWTYEYSPYTSQDGKEIPAFEVHADEAKVCDSNEDRPREEQEANVRLIAAAPELLKALEKIIDCDAPDMKDAQLRSRHLMDAGEIARAVIAKAKATG